MTTTEPPDGVLLVDKPVGPTSHDVVAIARRTLRTRRIGHAGTLDPFASGLLLLCVGRATRIAQFLTGLPKRYTAELCLGVATDTDDLTGASIHVSDAWRSIRQSDFETTLAAFTGPQLQVPAAYSAKKVGGVRAHDAARAGRALELAPVQVQIYELRLTQWAPPLASFTVACSSGTYVRALARDIGARLGTGAHLTALRRTSIGEHHVADAVAVAGLTTHPEPGALLMPPLQALRGMPSIALDASQVEAVRHGRAIDMAHPPGAVLLSAEGALVAIAHADGERVRPRKVFSA